MSAKPCCHTDSLWKESERKRGRRESWQVYRCIVSATQWCRERRIETPTHERLVGGFILTNCMSFCLYCDTFSWRFPPRFVSSIFSQISLRLPSCTSIFQHPNTLFSCLLAPYFFSLSPLLSPMSVVLSCVLMRQIKRPIHLVSSVLQIAGNLHCLLSSVSTDSYLSTSSSPSRSDWNWAK